MKAFCGSSFRIFSISPLNITKKLVGGLSSFSTLTVMLISLAKGTLIANPVATESSYDKGELPNI